MRHLLGCLAALLLVLLGAAVPVRSQNPQQVAPTEPKTPAEEQKTFKLPLGFVIELVAAEPEVKKPINMNFDDQGRLWVTESVEYPFPAPADKKGRDCVKVIDLGGGQLPARKITTFVDGLNIPVGVLPLTLPAPPSQGGDKGLPAPPSQGGDKGGVGKSRRQAVIVHSIPHVWRCVDTKGEGKADQREVLLSTFGFNDTHGMSGSFTRGFDGWIYAHHGFSNTSTVKAADGSAIKMQSGNTYRFKPDGARVEQFTWGQVNPFGLCFDPLGNLYSADCHTKPAMLLLRGGYYDSFGKPHDGLGYAPTMMTHDHGSTASCGIVYYAADHFPPEYRDTLYIGNVVTNRINYDKLEWHGSSPRAILQPDFLSSSDPWFRPVDLKLGPDGALYVADFYNRIIGHYEVPLTHPGRDRERGRIWRIRYAGAAGKHPLPPLPDLTKANRQQLIDFLGHPNLVVRLQAANQLVDRGKDEMTVLELARRLGEPSTPVQRIHLLWTLERLEALFAVDSAARDQDQSVRMHAMRVLGERTGDSGLARSGLQDSAFVQRAAADGLGRHPGPGNIRPLLALRARVPADDTHLLHTVRMALRDQFRTPDMWTRLPEPWTEADARALADVCPGLPTPQAGSFLIGYLEKRSEPADTQARYVRHAARFAPEAELPRLLQVVRRPPELRAQASLFRAFQQGTQERGGKLADAARAWALELTGKLLAAKENDLLQLGIELAGSLKNEAAQPALAGLVKRKDLNEKLRQSAIAALVAIQPREHVGLLAGVVSDAGDAMPVREHAINTLANLNQPESRAELLKALAVVPARLQSAISSGLAGSTQGAEQLLDAVAAGKASARLLQERPVEVKLQQAKLANLKERIAKLTAGLPPAEKRLQDLLSQRRSRFAQASTDAALGRKLFEKHCANCHQLANQGAKVGPQLDGIGNRGLDRLLEDIVDPNRNVDQAFRATSVVLKNGQIVMGLVLREEGEVVIVADAQGKEVRVPKNTIDEKTVSPLSPMPANLVDQIPEPDFYHLAAYLLAQRTPAAAQ